MVNRSLGRRWRAVVVAVIVLLGGSLRAEDVVKLHVLPMVGEKDDLLVQVRLTQSADNQFMKVVATSSTYYGSSEMMLDGQSTSPVTNVRFRSLPAGWYEIVGAVYDGKYRMRGSARTAVLVFSRGGDN